MNKHVVQVGDMKIAKASDIIITHALGSCVGMSIYDPVEKLGGLLHFQLAELKVERTNNNPLIYADSAIPLFLREFERLGGSINRAVIKGAGGAVINSEKDYFSIGQKNILAAKKMLWKYDLLFESEDFGGNHYRTMEITLSDGRVTCRNHDHGQWEL
ncbi:MAG: chemotaxis protein CheD [Spirochaetota bacterium]|nr:chemotaxis protein CheD [Spirochaetota bacterium]